MSYIPILILMVVGVFIGVFILVVSSLLGPKQPNPKKNLPFECGVPGFGDTRQRLSVRFYLVAILFLLFDVEAIFFFPWAVIYKKYLLINTFILWEMGFFVAVLLLGYFYALRKGALDWE
jgi:NADH-quinone oxidoreductase subunit A